MGELRNSIDFIANEETPVLAADDGTLIFAKDSSNIGGSNPIYWGIQTLLLSCTQMENTLDMIT